MNKFVQKLMVAIVVSISMVSLIRADEPVEQAEFQVEGKTVELPKFTLNSEQVMLFKVKDLGIFVQWVKKGSPAYKSGLSPGMYILEITSNGKKYVVNGNMSVDEAQALISSAGNFDISSLSELNLKEKTEIKFKVIDFRKGPTYKKVSMYSFDRRPDPSVVAAAR